MTREAETAEDERITRLDCPKGPHVVILGAGASREALPDGDANGRKLPLMADLVDSLDLRPVINNVGVDPDQGFEAVYSQIHAANPDDPVLRLIEERVRNYFSALRLPDQPTLYDLLLLSLRENDAIFTFNWDPFLADAYLRNQGKARLPQIFHLHGNVRAGHCGVCGWAGRFGRRCGKCHNPLEPTPLLFPVAKKNYSSTPSLSGQWAQAQRWLDEALMLTIFGYGAPKTDIDAVKMLAKAWKKKKFKEVFHPIQIIDKRDHREIAPGWRKIFFDCHQDLVPVIFQSYLFQFPRRSCETFYSQKKDGLWCGNPFPWGKDIKAVGISKETLSDFQSRVAELQQYEGTSE